MFCSKCGAEVPDGSNFCLKCGFNFNAGAAAAAAAAPQPATGPIPGGPPPIVDGRPWVQNSGVINPFPVPGYDQYNPKFHCRCEYCYYEFDYHTYDLGHRAWYPHGFVYCPRCKKPIRHRLEYEVIMNPGYAQPYQQPAAAPVAPVPAPAPAAPVAPVAPAPAAPAAPAAPEAPAKE